MLIEFYIASILICGATDECIYYMDRLGPVKTRVECQVRLDQLWVRILASTDIETKFPRFKKDQAAHQGMCFDNTKKNNPKWKEFWYER
jgi:hypothetical protein